MNTRLHGQRPRSWTSALPEAPGGGAPAKVNDSDLIRFDTLADNAEWAA